MWGCFAAHGVGKLYRVNGNLEQNQFHSILVHQMMKSTRALFPDGNFCVPTRQRSKAHSQKESGVFKEQEYTSFEVAESVS